ncbi:hypothetical protein [Chryseobacterium sp. JAH]|nr:hypothetical protein [Chryseobacterium sp. JAH]
MKKNYKDAGEFLKELKTNHELQIRSNGMFQFINLLFAKDD